MTTEELERLLTIKVDAYTKWSEAHRHAGELTSTDDPCERVRRDIKRMQSWIVYNKADEDYEAALREYVTDVLKSRA